MLSFKYSVLKLFSCIYVVQWQCFYLPMALTEEKEVEGDMAVPACFAGSRREQGTRRGQVGQDFSFGFF